MAADSKNNVFIAGKSHGLFTISWTTDDRMKQESHLSTIVANDIRLSKDEKFLYVANENKFEMYNNENIANLERKFSCEFNTTFTSNVIVSFALNDNETIAYVAH